MKLCRRIVPTNKAGRLLRTVATWYNNGQSLRTLQVVALVGCVLISGGTAAMTPGEPTFVIATIAAGITCWLALVALLSWGLLTQSKQYLQKRIKANQAFSVPSYMYKLWQSKLIAVGLPSEQHAYALFWLENYAWLPLLALVNKYKELSLDREYATRGFSMDSELAGNMATLVENFCQYLATQQPAASVT